MARHNRNHPRSSSAATPSIFEDTPQRTSRSRVDRTPGYTASPGPSSDKENSTTPNVDNLSKRSSARMDPPALPTQTAIADARGSKRRRLAEMPATNVAGSTAPQDFFDPDQPENERSVVTRGYRDVNRDFTDNRDRLMRPDNNEILQLITKADSLMTKVKQTNVATIDSRFLVGATDLTLKKANLLALGDGSTGVDVDEFVSKCISFMRNGGPLEDDEEPDNDTGPTSTATRRNTQSQGRRSSRRAELDQDDDDEAEEDIGDALEWDVLGRLACFPSNRRPGIPGHLLGPLGVQKRSRQQSQRRPRLPETQHERTQPKTLELEDLERAENSNLTSLCKNIRVRLDDVVETGRQMVDRAWTDDTSAEQGEEILKKAHLAENGEASLLEFAINPKSFGQTVENLFYISFLIREGSVEVKHDKDGLPTLVTAVSRTLAEQREQNVSKHQAVFSLDYVTWKRLIEAYEIKDPLIPHRSDEGHQVTARGWYG